VLQAPQLCETQHGRFCDLCDGATPFLRETILNKLLKNSDSRLFKKVQMRGARKIDERRRT
jgi:hypothetical protein